MGIRGCVEEGITPLRGHDSPGMISDDDIPIRKM